MTVKIEHSPHVGNAYANGLDGKRIAIMGYSHHSDHEDHNDFTINCVANVSSGKWTTLAFFNQIADYFHSANDKFWSTVSFLNFLPRKVGGGDERFEHGSTEDTEDGKSRATAFLEKHKPDFLFVFSRKAWESLPPSLEDEQNNEGGARIFPDAGYDRQHYRTSDGHIVQAFGLRHPQGANKEQMRAAVAAALAMEPNPPTKAIG